MTSKIPIVIAITNGLSGVMAWAYRLKRAFPPDTPYSIQLMGCRESDDYGPIDLYARNQREARNILLQMGNAIIMPNFLFDLFDICHSLIRSGSPLRTIGFCRSDSLEEYYEPLRLYQQVITRFIAVSDRCAKQLAIHIPHRREDIVTLPTGIDYAPTLVRTYSTAPIRIILAGRMEQKQKRILDLIPLLKCLLDRKTDFQLTLAGGGRNINDLMNHTNALTHGGRVKYIGCMPYNRMAEIYREHDLFIQLSEYEGTSNSMLEAMAQGVIPIVTETASGSRSVIQSGSNGQLVPVGDMDAMADHIKEYARLSVLDLQKIGHNVHASVEYYSMPNYIRLFIQVLDQTIAVGLDANTKDDIPAHRPYGLPMQK